MKVLHVSVEATRGGAARCLCLLHDNLPSVGCSSRVLTGRPPPPDNTMRRIRPMSLGERILYHAGNRLGLNYAGIPVVQRLQQDPFFQWADVVHYHNLHGGFFNYRALPVLTTAKPSVWTLHDMWGITGHCTHSFECERWRIGCGHCPHPEIDPPIARDATRWEWRLKQRAYGRSSLVITAPSEWLCSLARASMQGSQPVRHVANAVDTDLFKPGDKTALRKTLGWPVEALILLFVAESLDNPFKDFALLLAALQRLAERWQERVVLVAMGSRPKGLRTACGGFTVLTPGYLDDEQEVANCQAAADLLVYPTRADNQPRVVLEAMACGTPVVATAVGGLSELVLPGRTGYCVQPGDVEDLARRIDRLLGDKEARVRMGQAGRERVEAHHALQPHLLAMQKVYAEAIANHGGRTGRGGR